MTLLGRRMNVAIKNADFATKKEQAYRDSDILMTRELLDSESWDAASIDERQVELSGYIFEIWSFPGEDPPPEGGPAEGEGEVPAGEGGPEALPEVPTG